MRNNVLTTNRLITNVKVILPNELITITDLVHLKD